ncbi:DUF1993 domain-containing protein [Fulvimarina sp. MAC3]|uniref:DUF1993 domain-containing protein n=1 Tax=Fulvimarina sp. MAC3 TaxID=3148887 RepID=UPI0031FDCB42
MNPLHQMTVPTHRQMLSALIGQLAKAADTGTDSSTILAGRLAPDMFPLATQIRFSCLQSLECMDRLTGDGVRGADSVREVTAIEEAVALIEETVETLGQADPARWNGAESRAIEIALPIGVTFDMTGADYVRDWALPQFYFHIVTAYAIMRQAGVDLGKADYVPYMFAYARKPG